MLQEFSLVRYLKGPSSFVLYLQLLNAELVFATSDNEFNYIFIDNGRDLHHKQLKWFLGCQKFLIFWVQLQKSQAKSFL